MSDDVDWDDIPDLLQSIAKSARAEAGWSGLGGLFQRNEQLKNQQAQLDTQRKQLAVHRVLIQELERLREIQEHHVEKAQIKSDRENALPQCPACGGRLEGVFPKCRHCASDITWITTCPFGCGQIYEHENDPAPLANGYCARCMQRIPPDIPELMQMIWTPVVPKSRNRIEKQLLVSAVNRLTELRRQKIEEKEAAQRALLESAYDDVRQGEYLQAIKTVSQLPRSAETETLKQRASLFQQRVDQLTLQIRRCKRRPELLELLTQYKQLKPYDKWAASKLNAIRS